MMVVLLVLILGLLALSIIQQLKLEDINMKLSELTGVLETINTQLEKVRTEVQKLKDSLSDVDLPPEAEAALGRLQAALQGIDDINPDAT